MAKAKKSYVPASRRPGQGQMARGVREIEASPPDRVTQTAGPPKTIAPTKFLLLGGAYQDDQGNTWDYKKGEDTVIESTLPLDEIFANSFRRLDGGPRQVVPEGDTLDDTAELEAAEVDEEGEEDEARIVPAEQVKEESKLGEDVTDHFPQAQLAGLKVFKDGKHYHVARKATPEKAMNREEFTRKDQVESYIDKHVD